jgi:DNA-binding IclR family transcriptional regulator
VTGETITDPDRLVSALADVRVTGTAEEAEEAVLGECSLAAPIGSATGETVGAIGLVTAATGWPLPSASADALRAAARAVSRELGAARWPPG